jgi:hypothetical protein
MFSWAGRSLPAAQIFPSLACLVILVDQLKLLFLFELVSQHLTLPARDQLFVSGEKSGGFFMLGTKKPLADHA